MSMRLRRGMFAATGPGWAVTNYDGDPLPGRWATKQEATDNGLVGVYLLSGVDVVYDTSPCHAARTGEGYWTCDVPGGCTDCRALARELDDDLFTRKD